MPDRKTGTHGHTTHQARHQTTFVFVSSPDTRNRPSLPSYKQAALQGQVVYKGKMLEREGILFACVEAFVRKRVVSMLGMRATPMLMLNQCKQRLVSGRVTRHTKIQSVPGQRVCFG